MPCLFRVHSGPYRGKVFPVEPTRPLLIGRALEADFMIPDGAIEPFHCRVEFESGLTGRMARVRALDMSGPEGAGLGLEVDGVPFDEAMLKSGDKVKIGETTLEFREGGEPGTSAGGARAEVGRPCVACRRPVPEFGGGRVLLGGVYCMRCVDLRLIVKRELGRYRVLRKIGRDAAEIVYLAEDLRSEPPEKVALHVLKSERQQDPRVLRRFALKAASGFALDSPLFPLTRDLVRNPDVWSYVEEFCDWPSLAERLQEKRTLAIYHAAKATHAIIEGLRFARRRGMVVGKLRAMRLYVSESGAARIRDYWLAPELEDHLARQVSAPEAAPPPPEAPVAGDSIDPRDEVLGSQASTGGGGSGGGRMDFSLDLCVSPPAESEAQMSADMRRYLAPDAKDLSHYRDESLDVRPAGAVFVQLACGAIQGEPGPEELIERMSRAFRATRRASAPQEPPPALARVLARALDRDPAKRYRMLAELSRDVKALLSQL